jgi:hypothetical protein
MITIYDKDIINIDDYNNLKSKYLHYDLHLEFLDFLILKDYIFSDLLNKNLHLANKFKIKYLDNNFNIYFTIDKNNGEFLNFLLEDENKTL